MSTATQSQQRGLQVTDGALAQLKLLQDKQGKELCVRVGVRQGGCSGMSYTMDFIEASTIREDDDVFDYEGFQLVCDRKSLLYIYGLVLDYIDAMIGGGFQFTNPNASQTCGCGKSFAV
jgi:iron-sulfur cluster assembly protein